MRLHITSNSQGEAVWWIAHRQIWMDSVRDYREGIELSPAYRVRIDGTRVEIPNGTPGYVYFGEAHERPPLSFVEDLLPEHHDLCVLVEAAFFDATEPEPELRLLAVDPMAGDYITDEWSLEEVHEIGDAARQVA
ncbi:hypothetical protein ACIBCN_18635 [Nocardia sp. NPDC051052]|uniref:hypothetical protein n=1 Tax=Nocardia sp. NPDC051052 TaxID=3364322 RepID=UPI0037A3FFA5